jgi:hypothetical protein
VPDGAVPLAYINVPTSDIGQHLKLVGTGKYTTYNTDGLTVKSTVPNVNITRKAIAISRSVSELVSVNKVLDSSFMYGIAPSTGASWSVLGGVWNWDLNGGRTSLNSLYDTEDTPAVDQDPSAAPKCVTVDWNTGTVSASIISDYIVAREAGKEDQYDRAEIAYQLSLWIATDPVDNYGYRRGAQSWQYQDITKTSIDLSVIGYDASGNAVATMWSGSINQEYGDTSNYLTQSTKNFLRFRSDYFKIDDPSIVSFRIVIGGEAIQGVYFDDVRLRSYTYKPWAYPPSSEDTIWSSDTGLGETVPSPNIIINPEFVDNRYGDGDFDTSFMNLCPDPGFENGEWSVGGRTWEEYYFEEMFNIPFSRGTPRTGSNYLWLGYLDSEACIDVTGLDNNKLYSFGGWMYVMVYDPNNTGEGWSRCQLKVRFLDATNNVIGEVSSAPITGTSSYQKVSLTFSSSGYSATTKWQLVIYCNDSTVRNPFTKEIWDNMELKEVVAPPIPYWTFYPSQAINPSTGVLDYNEANNKFAFGVYNKRTSTDNLHYIYSWKTIYKNGTFQLTEDFCNKYFNTQHIAVADPVSVSTGSTYGLSYALQWPGAKSGITLNMDSTLRGAFAEPFSIYVNTPWGLRTETVSGYGYVTAIVEGLDINGNVTETPLTYTIDPRNTTLRYDQVLHDDRTGWYFIVISTPKFRFSNTATKQARVTFKFCATIAGINTVSLNSYAPASSGDLSGSFSNINVYSFSNRITVDRVYMDNTGGWRLGIKDGIFERRFTMSSSEPSGSWLRTVGFNDGDDIVLIYTVPEYNLVSQIRVGDSPDFLRHFQSSGGRCQLIDNKTVWLGNTDVRYIYGVSINGVSVITGTRESHWVVSVQDVVAEYPDLLESVDPDAGILKFKRSFNDTDVIYASYIYIEPRYIYRGYYDGKSWHDLDLNPSAGHRFNLCADNKGKAGFDILNNPVVIYLIPTAAYYASCVASGNYTYHSAFELPPETRPTCFVRHLVGTHTNEGEVPGYPSAAIIGKVFIVPPGSINDVSVLDIRSRGGGLPEDWGSDPNYKPVDFVEEARVRIPVGYDWINTHVQFYNNDVVTILGLGYASSSGDPYAIVPSNSLFGNISMTTPSSGASGFQVGNSWSRTIGYTQDSSGNWYLAANQASTGLLFLKVNSSIPGSGDLFAIIRIKRRLFEGWNWDIGSNDGDPVMINGVVVFEVPAAVLTGTNGYRKMTSQQVEEAVQKHVAAGVHWIIRYV